MKLSRAKRLLVGTALGRSAMRGRQLLDLWRAVRADPEKGGMLCQDACAKLLLPGLCTSSSVFVDVGSHIGSIIADVRRSHPSMQVVAVEADPDKAAGLAQKFPDVEVHSCALGEADGVVTFYVDDKRPGYSSLDRGQRTDKDVRQISVPMRRLDDIISATARVEVVKIDVEGAELGVLRGSVDLISRSRPVILFESAPHGGESMGFTTGALFDWFAERDYELLVPNRLAHNGPALSREGFLESHHYPFRTLDYFAVAKERRIEIRDRARQILNVRAQF